MDMNWWQFPLQFGLVVAVIAAPVGGVIYGIVAY
jgi:hypothetical protein